MKKLLFVVVGLLLFGMNVIAADTTGYNPTANTPGSSLFDAFNPIKYVITYAALYYAVIPGILLGTVVSIAVIVVLQYLGIDVIGWSIEIGKFLFENLFLLIRWTLATEANLISMVVLFLIFWIFILFGLPKMM